MSNNLVTRDSIRVNQDLYEEFTLQKMIDLLSAEDETFKLAYCPLAPRKFTVIGSAGIGLDRMQAIFDRTFNNLGFIDAECMRFFPKVLKETDGDGNRLVELVEKLPPLPPKKSWSDSFTSAVASIQRTLASAFGKAEENGADRQLESYSFHSFAGNDKTKAELEAEVEAQIKNFFQQSQEEKKQG